MRGSSSGSIFLAGGGDELQSRAVDELFLSALPHKRVAYLPIALDSKKHPYDDCLRWLSGAFEAIGPVSITLWPSLTGKTLADLEPFDALYVGGENTYALRQALREANFDQVIQEFIQRGKTVYGGSAGAIVLGNSITPASVGIEADINTVGLANLSGLQLLGRWSVHCHYHSVDDDELIRLSERGPIMAIPEHAGVHMHAGTFFVIGSSIAVFVTGTKSFHKPGTQISITAGDLRGNQS